MCVMYMYIYRERERERERKREFKFIYNTLNLIFEDISIKMIIHIYVKDVFTQYTICVYFFI